MSFSRKTPQIFAFLPHFDYENERIKLRCNSHGKSSKASQAWLL